MLMQCQEARRLLHELLDGGLDWGSEQQLRHHLRECHQCQEAERTLRATARVLREVSLVSAPPGFTTQVMHSLPASPGQRAPGRMLAVAAMVLFLLAIPLYFSDTLSNPQLLCRDREALIVWEDGTFVVPAGQVVEGDITVYRSNLLVRGSVLGNVAVVDGHLTLDSQGKVAGTTVEQKSSGALRMKLALAELWEDIGVWLFSR